MLVASILVTAAGSVVMAPRAEAATPKGDIVFIVDESGSMGPYQSAARARIGEIADQLNAAGVDFRLGLVGFGSSSPWPPRTLSNLTTDVAAFKASMSGLRTDGGTEYGFGGVSWAMDDDMGHRPDARACAVLVSDEDSDIRNPGGTIDDAKAALNARGGVFLGIVNPNDGATKSHYGPNAGSLAAVSGGEVFDLSSFTQDASAVLQTLFDTCIARVEGNLGSGTFGGGWDFFGYASDPVNTATGNFTDIWNDLDYPGLIEWTRSYNSRDDLEDGAVLGRGWSSWADVDLSVSPQGLVVRDPSGRRMLFRPDGVGGWASPMGVDATLIDTTSGGAVPAWPPAPAGATHALAYADGTSWFFDAAGALLSISDWTGESVAISRDGSGQVTAITSSLGYGLTFTYDADGHIVQVTGSDGATVSYGYAGGLLTSATGPDGGTETYSHDGEGRILEVVDPGGRLVVRNEYDEPGRVARQTNSQGGVTEFVYEAAKTSVTDLASGDVLVYTHDQLGRVLSITDPAGNTVTRNYNDRGDLTDGVDRRGGNLVQTWDARGNLLSVTHPDGSTESWTYDGLSRVLSYTDSAGGVSAYEYDGDNRIPSAITDPTGATTTQVVHDGRITSTTDADGVTTTYGYDRARNLTSETDGAGKTTTYTYDAAGNQTTATTPLGHTTTYTYDTAGHPLTETDPLGNTTSFGYDAAGDLITETGPTGAVTTYAYDAAGNLVSEVDPTGATTTFSYDAAGDLVSETGPAGGTTSYGYGPLARLMSETDPAGVETSYGYDADGNQTAVTDGVGNTATSGYDARGRVTAETDAAGNTTTYDYDDVGNVTSETDPTGATTNYRYDAARRLVETAFPDGGVETRTYTPAGRLATVTDPAGNTTSYDYDTAGRQKDVTLPGGGTETTSYDADGNTTESTSAAGLTTSYEYDAAGRETARLAPDGGRFETAYDARGLVSSETDPTGATVTYSYDAAGRVNAVTDPNGGTTAYTYDASGNRASRTDANGSTASWEYDSAGRLVAEIDPLGNRATTGYDAAGRTQTTTGADGRSEKTTYDPRGLPIETTWTSPDGTQIEVARVFDAGGRLTSITGPEGTTSYTYDALGRLTSQTSPDGATTSYSYDAAGRRSEVTYPDGTVVGYDYDPDGRLAKVSAPDHDIVTYSYDADGRVTNEIVLGGQVSRDYTYTDGELDGYSQTVDGVTTKTDIERDAAGRITKEVVGGKATSYSYDAAGQLTGVKYADGKTIRYSYDGVGNRTAVDDDGKVTTFAYDAAHRLISASRDGAPVDGADHLVLNLKAPKPIKLDADLDSGDFTLKTDKRGRLTGVTGRGTIGGTAVTFDIQRWWFLWFGEITITDNAAGVNNTFPALFSVVRGSKDKATGRGVWIDLAARKSIRLSWTITENSGSGQPTTEETTYDHDAAGRLITERRRGGDVTTVYDPRGLPVERTSPAGTAYRTYDAAGMLTGHTTEAGGTTAFIWDAASPLPQILTIDGDESANLVNGLNRAAITHNGAESAFAYDHLGSAVSTPDTDRFVIAGRYSPWGNPATGDGWQDDPLADPEAETAPRFGYRGELHVGNQQYLRARWYTPSLARFTSTDPLDGVDGTVVVSNPYHYANNSPTNFMDATGTRPGDARLRLLSNRPAQYGSSTLPPLPEKQLRGRESDNAPAICTWWGCWDPVEQTNCWGICEPEYGKYSVLYEAIKNGKQQAIRGVAGKVLATVSNLDGAPRVVDRVWQHNRKQIALEMLNRYFHGRWIIRMQEPTGGADIAKLYDSIYSGGSKPGVKATIDSDCIQAISSRFNSFGIYHPHAGTYDGFSLNGENDPAWCRSGYLGRS